MRYIIALFLLLITSAAHAACTETSAGIWEPDTLSHSDVQACVTAADPGDEVRLPAGSGTWTSTLAVAKSLKIVGAGIDVTTITTTYKTTYNTGSAVTLTLSGSDYIEVSNMTIVGPTINGDATDGVIHIRASGAIAGNQSFRIHDLKLSGLMDRGIKIASGGLYGVIDNCEFVNRTGLYSVQGVAPWGLAGDAWASPTNVVFGTGDFVFVEDCFFNYDSPQDGALDAYSGAKYVFRYNQVRNTPLGHHGKDTGPLHSTLAFEVYNNNFYREAYGSNISRMFMHRGGSGLVWGNTWDSGYNNLLDAVYYCATDDPTRCHWSPICTAYPCDQAPGRLMVDGVQVTFATYQWNNTRGGAAIAWNVGDFLTVGVDLVNGSYSYTPYTYPHPLRGESTPDPVCSPSRRDLCDDTNCATTGEGYWYSGTCNATPESTPGTRSGAPRFGTGKPPAFSGKVPVLVGAD